jgi:hypothetical protein
VESKLIDQYAIEFYGQMRTCDKCGDLRLQNCFLCTQEEECTTFPHCKLGSFDYYPPEFAFIGQDYTQTTPKVLFLAQIPYWTLENVAEWEQGHSAYAVPQHNQYSEFLGAYRMDFAEYAIVGKKFGILDICSAIFDLPKSQDLLERITYTNAAKCQNRSGSERNPNDGYNANQSTSDIATMVANCRENLNTEIHILNPDVILSFDRAFLPAIEKQAGGKSKDGISLSMSIAGQERLIISFFHPSMAGVNYAKAKISFGDRIRIIRDFMQK